MEKVGSRGGAEMSWGLQQEGDLLQGDRSPFPGAPRAVFPPELRVCHLLVFTRLSLEKGTWSVESCELMTQGGTDVTQATQRTAAQVVLGGGGAAGPSVGTHTQKRLQERGWGTRGAFLWGMSFLTTLRSILKRWERAGEVTDSSCRGPEFGFRYP